MADKIEVIVSSLELLLTREYSRVRKEEKDSLRSPGAFTKDQKELRGELCNLKKEINNLLSLLRKQD